ncbi:MAG: methylthioribulose 1-phosphate dehydratase [Synechococcaceae cyanobacterium]|nr:methylthioribulose 1-phosphate dehydratase [Synechococcaceae cyanobacterium]
MPPAAPHPDLTTLALGRELCRTMAAIHRRGWCDGTGGNFSCVLQHRPLRLLMAPSGVDKGRVRRSELIVVDAQGQLLEGEGRISAEMPLHRTIIETTSAGAVLHTHSQAATLLSRMALQAGAAGSLRIEGLEMLKGLEGISSHEASIAIPVLANDQDLERLSAAARSHLEQAPQGLLIAGHGLYAWGRDLSQAYRHLEILEFLLEQQWRQLLLSRCRLTGS